MLPITNQEFDSCMKSRGNKFNQTSPWSGSGWWIPCHHWKSTMRKGPANWWSHQEDHRGQIDGPWCPAHPRQLEPLSAFVPSWCSAGRSASSSWDDLWTGKMDPKCSHVMSNHARKWDAMSRLNVKTIPSHDMPNFHHHDMTWHDMTWHDMTCSDKIK